MLFEARFWPLIASGEVTLTFRRWKRRQVIAGNRYRTPVGFIEVSAVDVVDPATITDDEAQRSGYESADAVRGALRGAVDLDTYRIAFRFVGGPDPRAELAASTALSEDDRADLDTRLARMDKASPHGPWTRSTLELIAARPATRAGDLADAVGRERLPFKADVRKLKNLGLTESLEVGYRLSPRGRAYLDSDHPE
ncbi:MAG: hypothetical protein QOG87_2235 [Actinomycetota bacterium]